MSENNLTRDNLQLSRATIGAIRPLGTGADLHAADSMTLGADVRRFIIDSIAPATRRAYDSDLAHFEAWGGILPASPEVVASYLAAHVNLLSVATLVRRVASLSTAHEAKTLPNPCRSKLVRSTLRGIKRIVGTAQRQAKVLTRDDLFLALDKMGDSIKDARDRALLLLGFATGLRRSELVSLDCEDIERVRQGVVVTLRRSKTDQEGDGRRIGIPFGRTRHCPVGSLDRWLSRAGIERGPIFRPVNRHGQVQAGRLAGAAIAELVRQRVSAVGMDPVGFSGHSLRAGLATSAARLGVPASKIRAQTGHASDVMLSRYIREGELFISNAAGALL